MPSTPPRPETDDVATGAPPGSSIASPDAGADGGSSAGSGAGRAPNRAGAWARSHLPGLAVVAVLTAAAWVLSSLSGERISPLVIAVVLGVILTHLPIHPARLGPGLHFAAKKLLRLGVVLLGFRLSLRELAGVGAPGLAVVAAVVALTFFGTQWLGRLLGLSKGLSLLVATGYSICGASAIAAMDPLTDASEEEVAYAVALVTLAGTLAIFVLPPLGVLLGMNAHMFGTWVGASVHDVGQVVATASGWHDGPDEARKAAVIVKLTRVILLAPMVAGVSLVRRRRQTETVTDGTPRPPVIPLFVVGFLAAVAARSLGLVPAEVAARIKIVETLLLAAALVGLGAGVHLAKLRKLGGRPLLLGAISWALIGVVSYAGVIAVTHL